jgi:eukaryotic-like serine/threonine-protein kinase
LSLSSGTRLGPYEIVSALGAGGMGEVYRARDSKLNRDVALKILPEAVAIDSERIARFRREAQLLASLNHPHIAAIYGFEDSGSIHALVLELVEGPTLADRIAQGPLPLAEALPIAKQIADALEAAHEQGIIHRDLKPANIKVRADGTVKVLDFGLAKAMDPPSSMSPQVTAAPTITSPAMMTGLGTILGTAAYMSPEQAKGRPADKRSDVWAFGCVLYEMLTAVRPFEGEDIADTLAFVLTKEPDWSKLPSNLPPAIGLVLRRCLMKDRKRRIGDIAAVQFALEDPGALGSGVMPAPALHAVSRPRWRDAATFLAAVLVGAAAAAAVAWQWGRLNQRAPQPIRFTIVPPSNQPLSLLSPGGSGNVMDRAIAISPDGRNIVYRAGDVQNAQLMVRAIDQLDARSLGVGAVREAVFSPDGQWIAFFTQSELRKVSVSGGPSVAICKFAGNPRGLSWGDNETLVFASVGNTTGVFTVPAAGGDIKTMFEADQSKDGVFWFPSLLPGGRALLLTQIPAAVMSVSQMDQAQVVVFNTETKERKVVIRGGANAHYVDTGHLVYTLGGALRAVRFDLKRLEAIGEPVPILDGISTGSTGQANVAISRTGTLLYVPGATAVAASPQLSLVWVNRQGREEPIAAPLRAYMYPRISPDGTRVALDIRDQENDIWIWDLKRQTLTRLTFDPGLDRAPVWTPDGRRVIFSSQAQNSGQGNLFWKPADGTGSAERLTTSGDAQYPSSISPDGTRLVYRDDDQKTKRDIAFLTLDDKRQSQRILQTTFNEENGEVSPDGRWLAYQSDESGQSQVYVRPFPKVDDGRWQISPSGGSRPLWARNGRELFYLDATNLLMAVPVQTSPAFSAGNPAKVFDTRYAVPQNARTYDVSPDGQRFLMIKTNQQTERSAGQAPASIVVVVNWLEELKQRVPAK